MLQTSPYMYQFGDKNGAISLTGGELYIAGVRIWIDVVLESSTKYKTHTYRTVEHAVQIAELHYKDMSGTGSAPWLSSIAFFALIDKLTPYIRGKSVLELGCGAGLGGVAAAKFGDAKSVLMVDNDKSLKGIVENNIHTNLIDNKAKFIYTDYKNLTHIHTNTKYSCITALDCIYRSNSGNVADAIIANIATDGVAILINPSRDGLQECVYKLMETAEVDISTIPVRYGTNEMKLQMYICKFL